MQFGNGRLCSNWKVKAIELQAPVQTEREFFFFFFTTSIASELGSIPDVLMCVNADSQTNLHKKKKHTGSSTILGNEL